MDLSIVGTLYRSAPYVEPFVRESAEAAERLGGEFEIVLVNDGSPDDALAVALRLMERESRLRVVDLSRNFGHHKAMMAGLAHARGDRVFLIDTDLEVRPGELLRFSAEMDAGCADVIFGVQAARGDRSISGRLLGSLYYRVFNAISAVKLPENLLTERLMTRRYVDSLLLYQERVANIASLWVMTGFEQRSINVQKIDKGSTTYDLFRIVGMVVDHATSFSDRPLFALFYLGLAVSSLSAFIGIGLLAARLGFNLFLEGWVSVVVSVWLLGGLNLFALGLVGLYVARVFVEAKQRPNYVVRRVFEAARDG